MFGPLCKKRNSINKKISKEENSDELRKVEGSEEENNDSEFTDIEVSKEENSDEPREIEYSKEENNDSEFTEIEYSKEENNDSEFTEIEGSKEENNDSEFTEIEASKEENDDVFSIMESIKKDPKIFQELSRDEKKVAMIIDMYNKEKEIDDKKILELEKELSESNEYKIKLIENLLNILDQIDYVYKYSVQSNNEDLKKHLELINKEIKKIAKEIGLEEIECIGEKFNSKYHKGEGSIHDSNKDEGEIIDIIKKGYLLNGEVFRFASVVISK